FTEHDRLELIDGWVVQQMAKGPGHEYTVGRAEDLLRSRLPPRWHVRNQAPITLSNSEPAPDLVVVRGDRADYRTRHPSPSDVAMVIEVSDSSLAVDRMKGVAYGSDGIAEYWIVNLVDRCVEVYTSPDPASATGYAKREVFGAHDSVSLRIGAREAYMVRVAD